MFHSILDEQRKLVLAKIIRLQPSSFYLAGGTALALQLGHRDSIDFDWFSAEEFDSQQLVNILSESGNFSLSLQKKGTIHGFLDSVQLTYLYYPYQLIEEPTLYNGYSIASLTDIALMKMIAISQRGAKKDFIDLYAVMLTGKFSWKYLLDLLHLKFQNRPPNLYHLARSFIFFDDGEIEPMPKMYVDWNWSDVKRYFLDQQHEFSKLVFEMK